MHWAMVRPTHSRPTPSASARAHADAEARTIHVSPPSGRAGLGSVVSDGAPSHAGVRGEPADGFGVESAEPLVAGLLARIGVELGAQRVELYLATPGHVELQAWWAALGYAAAPTGNPAPTRAPLTWFPWSLGNVRATEYVFVRNADPLPVNTDGATIGTLGFASAVHLPLQGQNRDRGSLCCYWSAARSRWPSESAGKLTEWGEQALATVEWWT